MKPKVILCLSILLFGQQMAKAQFDALPDSNAQWKVDYLGADQSYFYSNYYWITNSDSMINGRLFNNVSSSGLFISDNDSGQVYLYIGGATHLLYDFDVEVGDTVFDVYITEMPLQHMRIISVDTVLLTGKYRKRIGIVDIDGSLSSETQYWIQGIGGTGGLVTTCNCIYGPFPTLVCMSVNDTIQFGFGEGYPGHCFDMDHIGIDQFDIVNSARASPNPSSGLFDLGRSAKQINLYNAHGKLLFRQKGREVDLGAYPPGMYTAVVEAEKGRSTQRLVVVR